MQNDVLRNTIVPWQEKGRWYHAKFDFSAGAIVAAETDQYLLDHATATLSGTTWYYNFDRVGNDHAAGIIDYKVLYTDIPIASTAATIYIALRHYTNGNTGFIFALSDFNDGFADIWVFVV